MQLSRSYPHPAVCCGAFCMSIHIGFLSLLPKGHKAEPRRRMLQEFQKDSSQITAMGDLL